MTVRVVCGDSCEVLRGLADCSVDSVVCDPPYELGFMGKVWDSSGVAYQVGLWGECLRVLKPGGFLLAFGGTRTYHRMVCAIEDAGFEIRDSIHWVYGSGFPKSLDVSKGVDRLLGFEREKVRFEARPVSSGTMMGSSESRPWIERSREVGFHEVDGGVPVSAEAVVWDGWGTGLKPAHEPIVVARKPLVGTVVGNVLEWGTGALNIDGCRVPNTGQPIAQVTGKGILGGTNDGYDRPWKNDPAAVAARQERANAAIEKANLIGRWPANLVLTHAAGCRQVGLRSDTFGGGAKATSGFVDGYEHDGFVGHTVGVPVWSCVEGCPVAVLDGQHDGASRFFAVTEWDVPFRYVAKPNKKERNEQADVPNVHPTVKPVELMRWLVRLVTRPGGLVLDPFAGSGTTLVAAVLEGCDAIGVELTADYVPIIEGRVAWAEQKMNEVAVSQPSLFGDV